MSIGHSKGCATLRTLPHFSLVERYPNISDNERMALIPGHFVQQLFGDAARFPLPGQLRFMEPLALRPSKRCR